MDITVYSVAEQASGAFNGGEIIENKPIGFPREGGKLQAYSSLFYWANAIAKVDSTIGLHPHKGFEIMSFVLEGNIRHFDTKQNKWLDLSEGDVQIIRAGNGISHSEFMAEGSRMFQIWLDPNLQKTLNQNASYDDYRSDDFPRLKLEKAEITTLIGEGSPLQLDTEGVETHRIKIVNAPYLHTVSPQNVLGIYILEGTFEVNGKKARQDDFVVIKDCDELQFDGTGEVFMFSTPKELSYRTYSETI